MFQEDFWMDLKTIPEVATFTGGRVFSGVAPKEFTKEGQFVTFTSVSNGLPELHFGGDKGKTTHIMQVDIYSTDYGVSQTVAQYVIDHYHGFTGTLNSQTHIGMCEVIDVRNEIDSVNPASILHRAMLTISFIL